MAFSPSCRCDDKANTGATLRMKSFGLGGRVWKVAGKLGTSYDSRASGWSALRETGCRGRQPLREGCRRAMLGAAGGGRPQGLLQGCMEETSIIFGLERSCRGAATSPRGSFEKSFGYRETGGFRRRRPRR